MGNNGGNLVISIASSGWWALEYSNIDLGEGRERGLEGKGYIYNINSSVVTYCCCSCSTSWLGNSGGNLVTSIASSGWAIMDGPLHGMKDKIIIDYFKNWYFKITQYSYILQFDLSWNELRVENFLISLCKSSSIFMRNVQGLNS